MSEQEINNNKELKNEINNNTNNEQKDSFDKLFLLQQLIQKQAGLKELCKKKIIFNLKK